MTTETDIAALATKVTAVNVDATSQLSTLALSVTNASGSKTSAEAARDVASIHKDAAEAAALVSTTQASGAATAAALAYQNLESISETKSGTAVDVFVYDTSKDSDGGAWRTRTQHTSWYNETLNTSTRGSRKEFPAVAVIVAHTNTITIYDGDDPSMSMWMVFNANSSFAWVAGWRASIGVASTTLIQESVYKITMLNGTLLVGNAPGRSVDTGIRILSFIKETTQVIAAVSYGTATSLRKFSKRNTLITDFDVLDNITSSGLLVHNSVRDVAMTVLPNAPIDPLTRLPVPTIAVATSGGVSVIKDDGQIFDIKGHNWGGSSTVVVFTDTGLLLYAQSVYFLISCDVKGLNQDYLTQQDGRSHFQASIDTYPFKGLTGNKSLAYSFQEGVAVSSNDDFDFAHREAKSSTHNLCLSTYGDFNEDHIGDTQMNAYITDVFNTGWMHGDIKLATLADTCTEPLINKEIVRNGSFNQAGTGNGIISTGSVGTTVYNLNGQLHIEADGIFGYPGIVWQLPENSYGQTFIIEADVSIISGSAHFFSEKDNRRKLMSDGVRFSTTHMNKARSSSTQDRMGFSLQNDPNGHFVLDNISIRPAVSDRATVDSGLRVVGSLTRTPVATGAELVQYSGFTSNDYIEDTMGDLPLGTDFCCAFWTPSGVASLTIYDASDDTPGYGSCLIRFEAFGNSFVFRGDIGEGASTSGSGNFIAITVSGTTWNLYVDGVLVNTGTYTETRTWVAPKILIGARYDGNGLTRGTLSNTSMALLRVSSTAPTAEQVAKMYRDEKPLFEENAKCTFYGENDRLYALDYDEGTELLHVGTPNGISVFKGLEKVSNTTYGVLTALSASNGLVVEE